MKQPTMKIISTGEEYKVASLTRLDKGTTLRAYPAKSYNPGEGIKNYVIVKGEGEETEINAEFIID